MSMVKQALRMLGLLSVVACQNQPVVEAPQPQGHPGWNGPDPTVMVYAESDERIHLGDTAATVFSRWPGAAPTDRQRVELINPKGRLYEVLEGPVAANGEAQLRMALAGSTAQEFNMHGTWTARFFINQGTAPVRELKFEVAP
jgi:hypothetical protein